MSNAKIVKVDDKQRSCLRVILSNLYLMSQSNGMFSISEAGRAHSQVLWKVCLTARGHY